MMRKPNHRRVKKRKKPYEKTKMKFTSVLAIIILAVVLGYLTARFVIGPILGYNADESPISVSKVETQNDDTTKDDQIKDESDEQVNEQGYALQFGVFSTREAAQELVESLQQKGIEAKIVEVNKQYKVISPIIKTKDEALERLNNIKDKDVEDVFIASF